MLEHKNSASKMNFIDISSDTEDCDVRVISRRTVAKSEMPSTCNPESDSDVQVLGVSTSAGSSGSIVTRPFNNASTKATEGIASRSQSGRTRVDVVVRDRQISTNPSSNVLMIPSHSINYTQPPQARSYASSVSVDLRSPALRHHQSQNTRILNNTLDGSGNGLSHRQSGLTDEDIAIFRHFGGIEAGRISNNRDIYERNTYRPVNSGPFLHNDIDTSYEGLLALGERIGNVIVPGLSQAQIDLMAISRYTLQVGLTTENLQ